MRAALDSNVISALWTGEPASVQCRSKMEEVQRLGSLVICGPVFCELHACPGVTPGFVDRFLRNTGIVADFAVDEALWRDAASRFSRYAQRRRKSGGNFPKRMLADFIVGAHALLRANCLLTLDRDRYMRDFPELKLL